RGRQLAAAPRRDAAPCEQRLVVAAQEAGREAVAPLDLAEERLPVLRVAHGARRDRECALGTESLERPPELDEAVADAGDGRGEEPAPPVDALAEARDR